MEGDLLSQWKASVKDISKARYKTLKCRQLGRESEWVYTERVLREPVFCNLVFDLQLEIRREQDRSRNRK